MTALAMSRPGDLIFYRSSPRSSLLSRIIAMMQILRKEGERPTQYVHVAVLADSPHFKVEARWPRVRIAPMDWDNPDLELWRIRGITDSQKYGLLSECYYRVGQAYDIGQLLFGAFDFKHAEICTTLVVNAAAEAGIILGQEAGRLISPNELCEDKLIERIA